jgi:hypothetical protein
VLNTAARHCILAAVRYTRTIESVRKLGGGTESDFRWTWSLSAATVYTVACSLLFYGLRANLFHCIVLWCAAADCRIARCTRNGSIVLCSSTEDMRYAANLDGGTESDNLHRISCELPGMTWRTCVCWDMFHRWSLYLGGGTE